MQKFTAGQSVDNNCIWTQPQIGTYGNCITHTHTCTHAAQGPLEVDRKDVRASVEVSSKRTAHSEACSSCGCLHRTDTRSSQSPFS